MRGVNGRGSVVWLVVRADLRRHALATLALALLVGIVGATTIVALSGSRRASTSFERLVDQWQVPNIDIEFEEPQDARVLDRIMEIPHVEQATLAAFVAVAPEGAGVVPFVDSIGFAPLAGTGSTDPVGHVVEGRNLGSDPDEVLLNRTMAAQLGVGVGDRIPLISLTADTAMRALNGGVIPRPDGPRTTATVVGIIRDLEDISDVPEGYAVVPAAYAEHYDVGSFPIIAGVRVSDARVTETVGALRSTFPDAVITPSADFGARIDEGLRVQSVGLLVFALVVGLTGAIAIVQQIGRSANAWSQDHRVLGALGATVGERRVMSVARALPVALGGVLFAVLAGILAGPLAVTGLARQAEPDPGIWFDGLAVGLVVIALVGIVLGAAWASVGSGARRAGRRGRFEHGLLARLPTIAFLGARRSLGADARRWSGLEALGTLAMALLVVVALFTFASSVDRLFDSPRAWGANFDAYVYPTSSQTTFDAALSELTTDEDIESVSVVADSEITMPRTDGSESIVRVLSVEQMLGAADPWVLIGGTSLRGDDQVLAGASVLDDLDAEIGDQIDLPGAGGGAPVRLRIGGEIVSYGNDRIDDAIAVTPAVAERVLGEQDETIDQKVVVVDFAEGVDTAAATAALEARYGDAGRVPAPSSIDNLDELGLLPLVLGVVVAFLGLYAVALSLALSVARDRGFFATLRAIGATRGQRSRIVVAQGCFLVGACLVVAVPAGVIVGRAVYRAVAEGLGAIVHPAVPLTALGVVAAAALACVILIAGLPARRAAVVGSDALRTE